MTQTIFSFPIPFVDQADANIITIRTLNTETYTDWYSQQNETYQRQTEQTGFTGGKDQVCAIRDAQGLIQLILVGSDIEIGPYSICTAVETIHANFARDFLDKVVFQLDETGLNANDCNHLCTGWGWTSYKFDAYKKHDKGQAKLIWPSKADRIQVNSAIESICLTRNLVNIPAKDLGTDELSDAAHFIAKTFKANFKKITDKDLLKQNFPMIYAVGQASVRRPQLIELTWGEKDHPKITLVGKGIVFDSGGLNLKPSAYIKLMKKDMGGAAQVLGLAWLIMARKLPVHLRVLVPTAENSIDGNAFRPGDILDSRKGLSVEIGDTDAEGRLVVADALTYACEDPPELLIDFCTLTGAARVALGYDIPAYFSNRQDLIDALMVSGQEAQDPVWPLPLWPGYEKDINTPIADVLNDGKGRAGAIEAGLFLQRFIDPSIDWIHLDCYAWEQTGKAGRPQGGADTGLRAVYNLIEKRYA